MGNENKDQNIINDLEDILTKVAKHENFTNYKCFLNQKPEQGEGFLSEFFTGEVLNGENGEKLQVGIKKAPIDGFSTASDIGNEEIYKNEIYFYSNVFPILDKFQQEKKVNYPFNHIPKYFTGSIESANIFLAMENLKTQSYVLFDKRKFFDSDHLKLIFKTYGKLHALSFSFKQKNEEKFENLVKNFTNILKQFMDQGEMVTIVQKSFWAALKAFDPVTEADYLEKLKTVENVAEIFKSIQNYKGVHQCLIHGDCWSNNMLFKYKESGELEDIKLLDFQLTRSSSPVHDLSYFFYSGASKVDMDKLDYYLDVYYQSFSDFTRELGENPEEVFPLEVLKKEWKQYGVWGIYLGCQLWLMKLMDKDDVNNALDQNTEDYWKVWDEKWCKGMAEPDFIERAKNICLHAVEYGIIGS